MISVIIPVYKVEKYLSRCVDSIINQTYRDLEIILVDDGSPDNCPEICDKYALIDERVKVIHKENGGLSDARNVGFKSSTGEWILYVDSDDYIELDSVERFLNYLYSINEKLDLIVGVAKQIKGEITTYQKHSNLNTGTVYTGKDYIIKSIKTSELYAPAWLNFYSRDFIEKNHLYYKKGVIHEDMELMPKVFLAADKLAYLDYPFYNYIEREESIMTDLKFEFGKESYKFIFSSLNNLFFSIGDRKLRKYLYSWYTRVYAYSVGRYRIKENILPDNITSLFLLRNTSSFYQFCKMLLLIFSRSLYITIYMKFIE